MTDQALETDAVADTSAAADTTAAQTTQATTETAAAVAGSKDAVATTDAAADAGKAATDKDAADKAITATWPDNWRELAADGDDSVAKLISRYGSPKGVAKALKEANDLIRSGRVKRDMPDPKDEKAVAEWRKEQGIPEAPDGYQLPDITGVEWQPADKPLAASYFDAAHKAGLPQATVDATLKWYKSVEQNLIEQRSNADSAALQSSEDNLRKEWGGEYRPNMTLAKRFMEDAPIGAGWTEARLPDGRRLGDISEFIQWASDKGRQSFGDAAFLPGDGKASQGESRLAEIRTMQKADPDKYWSPAIQKEELALLDQQTRSKR